jgi:hypothetical protein
MSADPTHVNLLLAQFFETVVWFMRRYADAEKRAEYAVYGTNDPRQRLNKIVRVALRGTTLPKPNPAAHYDSEGVHERIMTLLGVGQELAHVADAWGFDNSALVRFLSRPDPFLANTPKEVDELLEQVSIRANNLSNGWVSDQADKALHELVDQVRALREIAAAASAGPTPTEPSASAGLRGVQKCWAEAHQSFSRAVLAPNAPPHKPLKGVWSWLREHDPDPEYKLPRFSTWAKYVRAYQRATVGCGNTHRRGREGRSTTRADEI